MARKPSRYREAADAAREQRRRLIVPTVLALAGAVVVIATLPGRTRTEVTSVQVHAGDRALLLDILGELKRAWNPSARQEALDRAKAERVALELPLMWLLGQPQHPFVPQALQLTAELEVGSVLDQVLALSELPGLRAPALLCADRLEPLAPELVEELLASEERDVVLAGIQIAAHRDPPHVPALLALLRSEDVELRRAAADALPERLPGEAVATLRDIAEDREPLVAVGAIEALANAPRTPATELFLAEKLQDGEEIVAAAALNALSSVSEPLSASTATKVWTIAESAVSGELQALAYLCLERTRSYAVAEVLGRLPAMDSKGRYFAARLLVAQGNPEGIRTLLEVCEEVQLIEQQDPEEGQRQAPLAFACRTLLGSIANMHATSTLEEFREWAAANPLNEPKNLPAAAPLP
jgi:hypothetical protein